MLSIGILLLISIVNGDISEKLRQGQGLERRPSNFQGLQPPLFAGAAKGGVGMQKASGATNIPRIVIPSHHGDENDENNLDRLCNDPFHSFLCLPVGPRKHRIDGRLRPGAVLPPGMILRGSNSNLREIKQPLTMGGGLLSDEVDGQNPKPSNNVPSFAPTSGYNYPTPPPNHQLTLPPEQDSKQGYVYKKPANPLPLPSQQVTTQSPPPGPSYQYLPAADTSKLDVRFQSQTFQKHVASTNSFSNKNTNNVPQQVPFRTSSSFTNIRTYPTYNFPLTTSRPNVFSTSHRTTAKPNFTTTPKVFLTQTTRPNIFPSTKVAYTYNPPTIRTTEKTPNFLFQAKSHPLVSPKYTPNRNNLNAADANTIQSTSLPAPSNQYLPSFNQEAKPTNQFPLSSVPKPSNEYLPAVEGQSTNLQPNVEGTALLADEVLPESKPLRKHERNHTLEELCNDAFHSFLCKPITKQRKRIDGRIRPGAKIPPHVLLGAGSAEQTQRRLFPTETNQEGLSLLSTEVENNKPHPGYPYNVPKIFFESTNVRNDYSFPSPYFTGAASDFLALAKKFTSRNNVPQNVKPSSNSGIPSKTDSKTETKGYFYPAPSNVENPSGNNGYNYERPSTPKPARHRQQNDGYVNQETQQLTQSTKLPAASFQTEKEGYLYPKPNKSNGYLYPKPSAGSNQVTFQYPTTTTASSTTSITTTTTPKTEPVPAGTSQDEALGYNYPKPSTSFTLPPTNKPQGYVYNRPPKSREFTLPPRKPTFSSVPFGSRLPSTVNQDQLRFRNANSFQHQQPVNNDLPPASQFEILKP